MKNIPYLLLVIAFFSCKNQKVTPISFDENCSMTVLEAEIPLFDNSEITIFKSNSNSEYVAYVKKCGFFVEYVPHGGDNTFKVVLAEGNVIRFNTSLSINIAAKKITATYYYTR